MKAMRVVRGSARADSAAIIPQDALVVRLVETVLNDGEQRLLVVVAAHNNLPVNQPAFLTRPHPHTRIS